MLGFVFSIFLCFAAIMPSLNCWALADAVTCSGIVPMRYRNDKISITDFGGAGDGLTLNTKAFRTAIYRIEHLRRRGGTLLYIPPGVYLTESFNLTSHMTLYLAGGAVIKATQDTRHWPLIAPLPSYGRGRERPGGRYMSFIHGYGLRDVIITGENGTIDGQGGVWWNMWRQGTLQFTRPNLIEFMHSRNIIISNVIFKNSPFWNIHPVYCSNVVIRYLTILAPPDSPNTDGIDPDSSCHVCIEDSYISTGDDLVSVKSGWDEYGITYGRPSSDITIRRITGSSPFAGIAVGSETSGGVENVLAEHINLFNMGVGIHLKTNIGRGGIISNITVSDVYMENVRKGIKIAGDVGDHPDDKFDPNALPVVKDVTIRNVWGENVQLAGSIRGLRNSPFTGICLSNIYLHGGTVPRKTTWQCSDVSGGAVELCPSARELGHTALDWNQRLMIILNTGRAIAFIHSQSPLQDKRMQLNVHGNIKASNIMINVDFTACISDYGFAQLAERVEVSDTWQRKPPPRPENMYCDIVCQKGDIYNFGIIMLDLLGGPKALKKCILERKEQVKNGGCDFFEVPVEGKERYQASQVLDVAVACTNPSADARPSIEQIMFSLGSVLKQ